MKLFIGFLRCPHVLFRLNKLPSSQVRVCVSHPHTCDWSTVTVPVTEAQSPLKWLLPRLVPRGWNGTCRSSDTTASFSDVDRGLEVWNGSLITGLTLSQPGLKLNTNYLRWALESKDLLIPKHRTNMSIYSCRVIVVPCVILMKCLP